MRRYLVMELVEGQPTTSYCDREASNLRERIALFRQVCAAVQYAHRNLVVHRDIKPSNILVTAEGVPKLLDFGIARLLDPLSAHAQEPTATGQRALTPQYASPEQLAGEPITSSADVYSLGVLLYRMLTGTLPFSEGRDLVGGILRVLKEREPPRPSAVARSSSTPGATSGICCGFSAPQLRRRLAGDLDGIVLKALRREPDRRYGSVGELSDDLQRHLQGWPVLARRGSLTYRMGKLLKRYRVAVAGILIILVLICGFTLSTLRQAQQLQTQRDAAQSERDKARQVADFMVDIFRLADPDGVQRDRVTVKKLLESGRLRVDQELADQPEVQATLLETIGEVYVRLGLLDEAEGALARSLHLRERLYGSDHPAVADSLEALCEYYLALGKPSESEVVVRRALQIRRQRSQVDRRIAASYKCLGEALLAQRQPEAAEQEFRRGLSTLKGLDEPTEKESSEALHALGMVLYEQGRLEEADALLRQAEELARGVLHESHPDLATIVHDRAVVLVRIGEIESAEPLYLEALQIYERTLGANHPWLAVTLSKLAGIQQSLGRFDEAEEMLQRAFRVYRETLPPEHPNIAVNHHNLGYLLYERADFEGAERELSIAITRLEQLYGTNDLWLATSLHYLGSTYRSMGRLAEAEEALRWALSIRSSRLPEDHLYRALSSQALGATLADLGRSEEAAELLNQAVSSWRRAVEKQPPGNRRQRSLHAAGLVDLAIVERHLGREELANGNLEQAAALIAPFAADTEVPRALETLAKALLLLDRREEARPIVVRLLAVPWRQPHFLRLVFEAGLELDDSMIPARRSTGDG